jgi:hypothetical protein
MASRFVSRRQSDGKYCVWDYQTEAVAQAVGSNGRYENLGLYQAIDAAIELNGQILAPPTPEAPQQVAQQQPQPQSKKK